MRVQISHLVENQIDLKALLKEKKITNEKLGKLLGVNRYRIGEILNSPIENMPINRLITILDILGYSMKILISKKDSM